MKEKGLSSDRTIEKINFLKFFVVLVITAICFIVWSMLNCYVISKNVAEYNFITRKTIYVLSGKFKLNVWIFHLKEVWKLLFSSKKIWHTFLAMPEKTLVPWFFSLLLWLFMFKSLQRYLRLKINKKTQDYGSARWMTRSELEKNNMLSDIGLIMGQTNDAELMEVVDTDVPIREEGESEAVFEVRKDRFTGKKYSLKKEGEIISRKENEHTLLIGATRSGKGVGFIIPTLFSWNESLIVLDPKPENWSITASFRSKFSFCFKFEPEHPEESIHYNPLLAISRGKETIADIQNLCYIIIQSNAKSNADPFWDDEGRRLLGAMIGYVIYCEAPENKNLKTVYSLLTKDIDEEDDEEEIVEQDDALYLILENDENLESIFRSREQKKMDYMTEEQANEKKEKDKLSGTKKHLDYLIHKVKAYLDVVRNEQMNEEELLQFEHRAQLDRRGLEELKGKAINKYLEDDIFNLERIEEDLRHFFETDDKTLSNVVSTMSSKLTFMADLNLQAVTDRSDFTMEDFVYGIEDENGERRPVSLYLCISIKSMSRLMPMMKIIFEQSINLLSVQLPKKRNYRLLLLLDEFAQFGKMESILKCLTLSAGFGILCVIVIQSYAQLKDIYGSEVPFIDNCNNRLIMRVEYPETCKSIEQDLGTQTVHRLKIDTSGSANSMVSHLNESWHSNELGRALMTADEIRKMPFTECLIISGGQPPYKAKKIFYYCDNRYRWKYLNSKGEVLPPPKLSDNWPHSEIIEEKVKAKENGIVIEKIVKTVKPVGIDAMGWQYVVGVRNGKRKYDAGIMEDGIEKMAVKDAVREEDEIEQIYDVSLK